MLPKSMAGPNNVAQKLGFFIFFAGIIAAGLWYAQSRGWLEDERDLAEDDEEPAATGPDGGAPRRGKKKAGPHLKKKPSESRQARSGAARHPNPSPHPGPGPTGPSYESAIAGNNLKLAPGSLDAPDLTDAELAGPMRDGTFLDTCGVPTSMHVTVKVAIRQGRAVGISVYPTPPSQEIAGCVERHVRGLQWRSNAKMDSFITTY